LRLALLLPSLVTACAVQEKPLAEGTIDVVSARASTGVTTVGIVDWTVPAPADTAWIEFGADDTYGHTAAARDFDGTDARGLLLGVTPGAIVHYRVCAESEDTLYTSADQTWTAGELPASLHVPTLEDLAPDDAWGTYIMNGYVDIGSGQSSTWIADRTGEVVWYLPPREAFVLAARPSRDGRAVLYQYAEGVDGSAASQVCRLELDGETGSCVDTPYAHHDFVELADGSLAYPQSEEVDTEAGRLTSDNLAITRTDGSVDVLWRAIDNVPLPSGGGAGGMGWIHANGLWNDEASGAWYLSSYTQSAVYKIPAEGGLSEWTLGGEQNEFTFEGPEFGPQHAPQAIDGGLIVFDNSSTGNPSRAASYTLDEAARTATADIAFTNTDQTYAFAMGDAHLLPNGYVAVAYGSSSALAIFDPEGTEVLTGTNPQGAIATQMYVYDDLYTMTPN